MTVAVGTGRGGRTLCQRAPCCCGAKNVRTVSGVIPRERVPRSRHRVRGCPGVRSEQFRRPQPLRAGRSVVNHVEILAKHAALLVSIAALSAAAGVVGFHVLRRVGISPDALAAVVGGALIALSLAVSAALPVDALPARALTKVLGYGAVLGTVYAISRWASRRWYRAHARRLSQAAEARLRAIVSWTRKQHGLFGWVVLATATAHALFYLPHLAAWPAPIVVSGIAAWTLMAGLVALGLRMARRARSGDVPKGWRTLHVGLAVSFVVALLVHG